MNKKKQVLLIVEGAKTERRLFERIKTAYGMNFEIKAYETNIYTLYQKLKELDFYVDISKFVLEKLKMQGEDVDINQKFIATYLVFDADLHHSDYGNEDINHNADIHFAQLKEMLQHFNNETDPTIGKLYINYPMVESYRDANSFFDDEYFSRYVDIEDLPRYKQIVNGRVLANKHIQNFSQDEMDGLLKMNMFKLSTLYYNEWRGPRSFDEYADLSLGYNVCRKQAEIFQSDRKICVLNTSLFFPLDYFGEKGELYGRLVTE